MLGREINLPLQILYPLPAQENSKPVVEYAYNLQQRLEEVYHTTLDGYCRNTENRL